MGKKVLITAANGMFGGDLARVLSGACGVSVRAMVRDRSKFRLAAPNLEVVTGDMDRPETLRPAVNGCSHVFLSSPMDPRIAEREINVIDAAADAGAHVLKIFGAVRHGEDRLNLMHTKVLERLKASGAPWTLISPNSVMETSLLQYGELCRYGGIFGISGHGKVGMVALEDVSLSTKAVILGEGHEGLNHELTGPAAIDLYDVAAALTEVLGRKIVYYNLPDEEFIKLVRRADPKMTEERMEIEIMCHLRAWREGKADLVTDTVERLTGRQARSIATWAAEHRDKFDLKRTLGDRALSAFFRIMYGRYAG